MRLHRIAGRQPLRWRRGRAGHSWGSPQRRYYVSRLWGAASIQRGQGSAAMLVMRRSTSDLHSGNAVWVVALRQVMTQLTTGRTTEDAASSSKYLTPSLQDAMLVLWGMLRKPDVSGASLAAWYALDGFVKQHPGLATTLATSDAWHGYTAQALLLLASHAYIVKRDECEARFLLLLLPSDQSTIPPSGGIHQSENPDQFRNLAVTRLYTTSLMLSTWQHTRNTSSPQEIVSSFVDHSLEELLPLCHLLLHGIRSTHCPAIAVYGALLCVFEWMERSVGVEWLPQACRVFLFQKLPNVRDACEPHVIVAAMIVIAGLLRRTGLKDAEGGQHVELMNAYLRFVTRLGEVSKKQDHLGTVLGVLEKTLLTTSVKDGELQFSASDLVLRHDAALFRHIGSALVNDHDVYEDCAASEFGVFASRMEATQLTCWVLLDLTTRHPSPVEDWRVQRVAFLCSLQRSCDVTIKCLGQRVMNLVREVAAADGRLSSHFSRILENERFNSPDTSRKGGENVQPHRRSPLSPQPPVSSPPILVAEQKRLGATGIDAQRVGKRSRPRVPATEMRWRGFVDSGEWVNALRLVPSMTLECPLHRSRRWLTACEKASPRGSSWMGAIALWDAAHCDPDTDAPKPMEPDQVELGTNEVGRVATLLADAFRWKEALRLFHEASADQLDSYVVSQVAYAQRVAPRPRRVEALDLWAAWRCRVGDAAPVSAGMVGQLLHGGLVGSDRAATAAVEVAVCVAEQRLNGGGQPLLPGNDLHSAEVFSRYAGVLGRLLTDRGKAIGWERALRVAMASDEADLMTSVASQSPPKPSIYHAAVKMEREVPGTSFLPSQRAMLASHAVANLGQRAPHSNDSVENPSQLTQCDAVWAEDLLDSLFTKPPYERSPSSTTTK